MRVGDDMVAAAYETAFVNNGQKRVQKHTRPSQQPFSYFVTKHGYARRVRYIPWKCASLESTKNGFILRREGLLLLWTHRGVHPRSHFYFSWTRTDTIGVQYTGRNDGRRRGGALSLLAYRVAWRMLVPSFSLAV